VKQTGCRHAIEVAANRAQSEENDNPLSKNTGSFLTSFDTRGDCIVQFAAKDKLPAIFQFREFAVRGGPISYGPNIVESYRNAGIYAGRILKGE